MQFPDTRILIFARSPHAGAVKTRLIPALGEVGACALHEACVRRLVGSLARAALAPLQLWVTPDEAHPLWSVLRATCACEVWTQRGGDLGQRMRHAARQALAEARQVILLGTDVPLLDAAYVRRAVRGLQMGADVVMGPAEDGGYVLLGLKRVEPGLFDGMAWGTERVAQQTRRACEAAGLSLHELEPLWDLDRPDDLERLRATPGLETLCEDLERYRGSGGGVDSDADPGS
jgi:rSAM/selenodomain-associated transferase 1